MKYLFLLLMPVALLCSCSRSVVLESEEEFENMQEPYIGVWKLKEISFPAILVDPVVPPRSINFSNHDVTFEFRADGVLIVKGDMMSHPDLNKEFENDDLYIKEGTHSYLMAKYEGTSGYVLGLKGGKLAFPFSVSKDTASYGMTGGGGLGFVRVKN